MNGTNPGPPPIRQDDSAPHDIGTLSSLADRDPDAAAVGPTHSAYGSGHPELILFEEDQQTGRSYPLREHRTRIGASADADITLPDIAEFAVDIIHDDRDEYVVQPPVHDVSLLRTGARLEFGRWILVYQRDEASDHGRRYGGRSGEGELSGQEPQEPRPDYRGDAAQARTHQANVDQQQGG